ncbi:MAG: ATP cone domain-containing protein, partial [Candidatus Uhrbacteria bacterium]
MDETNASQLNRANTTTKVDQNPDQVSGAVWDFMTSLKSVSKRSGADESFIAEKLMGSVQRAMQDAGYKDLDRAGQVTSQVIARLNYTYNGHTTPATVDIREVISTTLVDNNLIHVAKAYIDWRQKTHTKLNDEETYGNGVEFSRFFTTDEVHPYDALEWEQRDARITNEKGETVFEQLSVEMPKTWSQTATNIVVSKYFRGQIGKDDREQSVRELIDRVVKQIGDWGRKDGYFHAAQDAVVFEDELTHILVNQMAAFNSPVWFNVGINPRPQCSACFINSVSDDMRSIMNLATTESMIFKGGSGSGI